MKPLLDGDILLHELGWSGQFKDKDTGEEIILDWDFVEFLLDEKIKLICKEVGATEPPLIFLTDCEDIVKRDNLFCKWSGDEPRTLTKGYRYDVAVSKPYKGNRTNPKPLYFQSILSYLLTNYNCIVSKDGLEADDEMGIYQAQNQLEDETIICSRDKDLRTIPGWHYSWECGKQGSISPTYTDRIGWLEQKSNGDVLGYGLSFFYYQMLVGDNADHIPGLPKYGKVKAFKLLSELKTEKDLFECVKSQYKDSGMSKEYFLEQANLLYILQERDKDGKPVFYKLPTFDS